MVWYYGECRCAFILVILSYLVVYRQVRLGKTARTHRVQLNQRKLHFVLSTRYTRLLVRTPVPGILVLTLYSRHQ